MRDVLADAAHVDRVVAGRMGDGRRITAAAGFVDECRARGLAVEQADRVPFAAGAARQTIDEYEVTRPRRGTRRAPS